MKKPYHRKMPSNWYLKTPGIRRFMLRELTCVFMLIYMVSFLCFLCAMSKGADEFLTLMETLKHPALLILNGLVFIGVAYHSITWFNVTPQAMPIRIGEDRLPNLLVAILMGYLPCLVISGIVLYFTLK